MAENNENDKGPGSFMKPRYNRTADVEKQIFDDVMEQVSAHMDEIVKDLRESVEAAIRSDLQPETAPYDRLRLIEQRIHEISKTQDGIVREIVDLKLRLDRFSKELSDATAEITACRADLKEMREISKSSSNAAGRESLRLPGMDENPAAAGSQRAAAPSAFASSSVSPSSAARMPASPAASNVSPVSAPASVIASGNPRTYYGSYFDDPGIEAYNNRNEPATSSRSPASSTAASAPVRVHTDTSFDVNDVSRRSKTDWPSPDIIPASQSPNASRNAPRIQFEEIDKTNESRATPSAAPFGDPFNFNGNRPAYSNQPAQNGNQPAYSNQPAQNGNQPAYNSNQPAQNGNQPAYNGASSCAPQQTAVPVSGSPSTASFSPSSGSQNNAGSDPYGLAPTIEKPAASRKSALAGSSSLGKKIYTDDDDGIDYNKDCEYIYAESGPSGRSSNKKGSRRGSSSQKQEKTIVNDDEGSELIMRL